MPINFPNSPLLNDLYTYDDKTWQWNGIYWDVYSGLTGYITSAYTVGDGYSDISGVTNGYIALKSFSGQNINIIDSGSKLTFSGISVNDVPPFTGGTVSGTTVFTNGLTANTISATTYQNLPTDISVTGGTYSAGTATFTNNTGGTFTVTGFTNPFTGGTISGATVFTNGLSANTVSATTYQNLPTDVFTTGGTYSNGSATFTNNTGGTFTVTGFTNPFTGGTVSGATSFTNGLSANTISATTYQNLPTDVFTTGGTYSNNTFTYTNNTGGTFSVLFNTVTGLTVNGNATVTGNTVVNGIISGNTIFSTQSSGDEGGQIDLFKPQTNTTISGTSVSIDVYQNKVRIFESGGNSRGAYIDITDASTGLTNNLLGIVAYKNISPVTVSATTSATLAQSIYIPANTFKAGDLIEVSYRAKKVGANGTCILRLNVNTTAVLLGATFLASTNFNPANNVYNSVFRTLQVVTSNNNTEVFSTAGIQNTDFITNTAAVTNVSLDWTVDQYVFTSITPASSADTVTSTYLLIKRIR